MVLLGDYYCSGKEKEKIETEKKSVEQELVYWHGLLS